SSDSIQTEQGRRQRKRTANFARRGGLAHKSIVDPLISPQCDHCRSTHALHETLLKTVRDLSGLSDSPVCFSSCDTGFGQAGPYTSIEGCRSP
ncbi:hypothetical protein EN860_035860, partial [Mesorhizobium sp. M00.F.Ca.ET.217.01.1.1]